ncbi:MAG: energy transducer TonB [Rhodothermales bacterium]
MTLPKGWQTDGIRWWRADQDTTGMFRNLETLKAMQVSGTEVTYLAHSSLAQRGASLEEQFERAVRISLIRLFRNQPELIDSLFNQYVKPTLQDATLTGDIQEEVEAFKRKGYKLLRSHFREPRVALELGTDVPVLYPDSLQQRQVTGTVRTQVYLNAEGEPLAIMLIRSVHPTLDIMAMRATTQMRWGPAYRMRKGRWLPTPSWVRFGIKFGS